MPSGNLKGKNANAKVYHKKFREFFESLEEVEIDPSNPTKSGLYNAMRRPKEGTFVLPLYIYLYNKMGEVPVLPLNRAYDMFVEMLQEIVGFDLTNAITSRKWRAPGRDIAISKFKTAYWSNWLGPISDWLGEHGELQSLYKQKKRYEDALAKTLADDSISDEVKEAGRKATAQEIAPIQQDIDNINAAVAQWVRNDGTPRKVLKDFWAPSKKRSGGFDLLSTRVDKDASGMTPEEQAYWEANPIVDPDGNDDGPIDLLNL